MSKIWKALVGGLSCLCALGLTTPASATSWGFEKSGSASSSGFGGSYKVRGKLWAATTEEKCDYHQGVWDGYCAQFESLDRIWFQVYYPSQYQYCEYWRWGVEHYCSASNSTTSLEAYADAKADARLFGQNQEVIYALANAKCAEGKSAYVGASARAMGYTVYSRRLSAYQHHSIPVYEVSRSWEDEVSLGPIDIDVEFNAAAGAYITVEGNATCQSVRMRGGPQVTATLDASASVGGWLASAGVSGEVTLADLWGGGVVTGSLDNARTVRVRASLDATYTFLDGSLKLWGKIAGVGGSKTLFSGSLVDGRRSWPVASYTMRL